MIDRVCIMGVFSERCGFLLSVSLLVVVLLWFCGFGRRRAQGARQKEKSIVLCECHKLLHGYVCKGDTWHCHVRAMCLHTAKPCENAMPLPCDSYICDHAMCAHVSEGMVCAIRRFSPVQHPLLPLSVLWCKVTYQSPTSTAFPATTPQQPQTSGTIHAP